MKRQDRIKAITALSLADLFLQHDGSIDFKAHQNKYMHLKTKIRQILFMQYKKDPRISSVGHEKACLIAEAINDEDLYYVPSYCALNILFDFSDELQQLPQGMRIDLSSVDQLQMMLVDSQETTAELLKNSSKIDLKISEMIKDL